MVGAMIDCCGGGPVLATIAAPPSRRHLLYHLMPRKGNGIWQLNVERLTARWSLFNGTRTVAIVTGPNLDEPGRVMEFFAEHVDPANINWLVMPNDSTLREVVTWRPLWETLSGQPAEDAVFYAQAKGVTRPVNRGTTIHRWTRILYAANLDYWPAVGELLKHYPLAGAMKKVGRGFNGSASTWHYTGSFFWGRLGPCLAKSPNIDRVWWGNESWPGRNFPPSHAGSVFGVGKVPELDMYSMSRFVRTEAEFEQWAQMRAGK